MTISKDQWRGIGYSINKLRARLNGGNHCNHQLKENVFFDKDPSQQGQIDLNEMLKTAKGTHKTSKWTSLGPQITEN